MGYVARPIPFIHRTPPYASWHLHKTKSGLQTLVVLAQPTQIGHTTRTIEVSIPDFSRQNPSGHPSLVIPLRSPLRRPCPIEPTPGCFEADHLGLRIHHQPLLIIVGVAARTGVGIVTRTCTGFRRTVRRRDGYGTVAAMERTLPTRTCPDVVEVGRAICVCLRPFATQCRAESVNLCKRALRLGNGSTHPVVVLMLMLICSVHPVHAYCNFF